ncbi:MAG TPA: class I SAM-dependent methyltransferase [Candidatus Saccharimonadales bacterium]|nr:class I SAM-dependent methyltransferase [Candidatus Saccharimonadales bacterium]
MTDPNLNVAREQGMQFYRDPEVVAAYSARNGYPPEAIRFILDTTILGLPDEHTPRILDAGCGTGLLTAGLQSDESFTGQIIALDASEAMISAMRKTVPGGGAPIIGNMDTMPFKEKTFDTVAFSTSLHWGDPECVPGELRRILRPGGLAMDVFNITRQGSEFSSILGTLPNQAGKINRMCGGANSLDLGEHFTFIESRQFQNDASLTPDNFFKLLESIEILRTPSATLANAWESLKIYARKHEVDGRITVPFDTFVRIAKLAISA